MATPDLYEPCPACDVFWDRGCPACKGEKFVKIGLTAGQLERLHDESRRWYHADGTFEVLTDPQEVTRRRIEAAKESAHLRAALVEVLDSARDDIRHGRVAFGSWTHSIEAIARVALEKEADS